MEQTIRGETKEIIIEKKKLHAAKCAKCGAKIFPKSLLKPHLSRHQRRQRWLNHELEQLQLTFAHMRDIA